MSNIEIKYQPDFEKEDDHKEPCCDKKHNDKDCYDKECCDKNHEYEDCYVKKHNDKDCCEKECCDKKHDHEDPCCDKKNNVKDCCKKEQTHDHEFLGSTRLAELCEDPHNHRFAGVTSPEIKVPGGHVHLIKARTDFFDHLHEFDATTGLQIPICEGKHVHFVKADTTVNDCHSHELIFATLINAPIFKEKKKTNIYTTDTE